MILARSAREPAGSFQLAGGIRLPAERQLAGQLGVSRSAVRHAMAVLEAEGRISREVGRGTFLLIDADGAGGTGPANGDGSGVAGLAVTPGPAVTPAAGRGAGSVAGADYSPADVMLVRRMFEPHAMALVVAWATERDFTEMDRCVTGGSHAADHDEFEVWDGALHHAIIAAARSPLLVRLYGEVEHARHGRQWGDLKRRTTSATRRAEYQRDHEAIVTALHQRDAATATAAMATHLDRVTRYLLGTG